MSNRARKKLLEDAIRRVFELHNSISWEKGAEPKSLPLNGLLAIFEALFVEVFVVGCGRGQEPLNKATITVTPSMHAELGEPSFIPDQKLGIEIVLKDLFGLSTIVECVKDDVLDGVDVDLKIVSISEERRKEPLVMNDQEDNPIAPAIYQKSKSYEVQKPEKKKGQIRPSAFSTYIYDKMYENSSIKFSVPSVFNWAWGDLEFFLVSLFTSYHDIVGTFERFCVCKNCGDVFLPVRYDYARGKFCSSKCRKAWYVSDVINDCYRKQKACIERRASFVSQFVRGNPGLNVPRFNATFPDKNHDCRLGCPHGDEKPRGGGCLIWLQENRLALNAYAWCKRHKRKKK